ncbi:MAG TPA: hypothetical protein VNG13_00170 [Mycobacteriales bacterium]|nr:hypothetical protein [Mycobacteriales bacterium]
MAIRDKRSISMPPDLSAAVEAAAQAEGTTFSGWLADTAARRLKIEAGLAGVSAFEAEAGELSEPQRAEGEAWARKIARRPAAKARRPKRASA